jgi:NADH:ubiquinone oxidoreductase subunit 2 (subunit N)
MIASIIRSKTLIIFITFYWASILLIINPISSINMKERSKDTSIKYNPWLITLTTATLAGLPPTIGFLAK